MPRRSPFTIDLSPEETRALQAQARKYSAPYREVVRAKAVLMAGQGLANEEIASRLDMPREVVSKWRKRFFQDRLAGLRDQPRSGRPAVFPPCGGGGGESTRL
ncbi:MAG: hypothetical protein QG597_2175 [Actinomycetota bacterium]|nr:hypothetical protein [Actinomycetota bacterium]